MFKKITVFFAFAGLMLHGCKDFDCCMPSVLSADVEGLILDGSGDTQTFFLYSPMSWKLQNADDLFPWLKVTPDHAIIAATVTVTADPNSGDERKQTLIFMAANGDKLKVEVTQKEASITAPVPPTITSLGSTTVEEGIGGTFTVTATGDPTITFSLSGTIPSGIAINATTGVITIGTSTPAGTHTLEVTATNGVSPDATQMFTLTVTAPKTVGSDYRFNGGTWYKTTFEPVESVNLTDKAIEKTAGFTGVYTEGGKEEDPFSLPFSPPFDLTITVTWAYLYDGSGKIGIACSFDGIGSGFILGKSACENIASLLPVPISGLDTDGMQDYDQGIGLDSSLAILIPLVMSML
ncbi:MAG: putative Ig domain-containing protein [Bacteroidetes bacterium]|nr:putative Ig domain-containing protein [Bacteroidota bacterium]